MNDLLARVVNKLFESGDIEDAVNMPLPAINKAEVYLTFNCNDTCPHCVTESSPLRNELISYNDVIQIINNISRFSILKRAGSLFDNGQFEFEESEYQNLSEWESVPDYLDDEKIEEYVELLQGRDKKTYWNENGNKYKLPFTRPSIRFSGGEFYMWPHHVNGETASENQRLEIQSDLLSETRKILPEYDIWILTNGRFASSQKKSDKVIKKWALAENRKTGARIRISISVDIFHRAPENSYVLEMLKRIWNSCKKFNMEMPLIYAVPNRRISLIGRAFSRYNAGIISELQFRNNINEEFVKIENLIGDPVDLKKTEGCNELKGFIVSNGQQGFIAHNIVIAPSGHLVYCCACMGDLGSFVKDPVDSLTRLVKDPVARLLRNKATVEKILTTAVKLDPSIYIFGNFENGIVTGSTCFQMISGVRR